MEKIDPLRFEDEIKALERLERKTPLPEKAVIFYGSSTIRMWNTLARDMAPLPIINHGFGGSVASDGIHYLNRLVLNRHPAGLVLYFGDNDLACGITPGQILEDMNAIVSVTRRECPLCKIFIISIKPSVTRESIWPLTKETNVLLESLCTKHPGLAYIDITGPMLTDSGRIRNDIFLEDFVHMNQAGYDLWKPIVKDSLLKAFR